MTLKFIHGTEVIEKISDAVIIPREGEYVQLEAHEYEVTSVTYNYDLMEVLVFIED